METCKVYALPVNIPLVNTNSRDKSIQQCKKEVTIAEGNFQDDTYQSGVLSSHALVWWKITSQFLLELVKYARFTSDQLHASMEFFCHYVVTNLGPSPGATGISNQWRSFMTDDFSPLEFSWRWGGSSGVLDRKIRFSFEPIGRDAGSALDPWNTAASRDLVHNLRRNYKSSSFEYFDALLRHMSKYTHTTEPFAIERNDKASPSTLFFAVELGGIGPLIKAYLLPAKSNRTHTGDEASTICNVLRDFSHEASWKSLADLANFLATSGKDMQLHPFMLAIDCISKNPRVKVYVRSADTSFAAAARILSLFEEDSEQLSKGLKQLQDLWTRVFCHEATFDPQDQLKGREHETSGVLYYFEVRPNSSKVTKKIYMPAKHYGRDDLATTLAIASFFKSLDPAYIATADRYVACLKALCTHRRLDEGRGMHTYIAATIDGGQLDVTSYLSPEIYHPNRYAVV